MGAHACMNAPILDPSTAWSPDATHVAFTLGPCPGSTEPDALYIAGVAPTATTATTATTARRIACAPTPIAWKSDSTALFVLAVPRGVTCNLSEVDLVSLADPAHPIYLGSSAQAALSPDRTRLVYAINTGSPNALQLYAVLVDSPGTSAVRVSPTLRTGEFASDPVWSPDSTRVAFASNAEGVEAIYVTDVRTATGAVARRIDTRTRQMRVSGARWSPDGRYLAYDGDNQSVYEADLSLGPAWTSVQVNPAPVLAWDISPDGGYLAFADPRGLYLVPTGALSSSAARRYDAPLEETVDTSAPPHWAQDGVRVLISTRESAGTRARIRLASASPDAAPLFVEIASAVEGDLPFALFSLP
jgi:Tol biopolymer transport system component